jgi:hypothetical protein
VAAAKGGQGFVAQLARLRVQQVSLRRAFIELKQQRQRERALERAEAERLKRRYDAAWDKFIAAFTRHWDTCRKAGFDPNQPRMPVGNPDGGQWTSEGGGGGISDPRVLSDTAPDNDWKAGSALCAELAARSAGPPVGPCQRAVADADAGPSSAARRRRSSGERL